MGKQGTNITSHPIYHKNPTMAERISVKMETQVSREKEVDEDTGEEITVIRRTGVKRVGRDTQLFIKMYEDGFAMLPNLNGPALKLFAYISKIITRDTDMVEVTLDDYNKFFGLYTKTSYYRAVNDLLEFGFIFRKENHKSQFFINVNFFFKGDRTRLD